MSQKSQVKKVLPFTVLPKWRIGSSLTRSCIFKECLRVVFRLLKTSGSICWCLFCFWLSGGVFQLIWVIFWDARAAWGCSRVFLETHSMRDPVRLEPTNHFEPTLKCKIFFTWHCWDIKISKPPYLPFPKMTEFCHFSYFWCLSKRNYNLQSLWITLYSQINAHITPLTASRG